MLRVFDASGTPLALDDQQGGDPSLTIQVPLGGDYYVGVSSAPNDNYNPNLPGSGALGDTTGLYTLGVRLITTAPLLPDLTGSSFRTSVDMAAAGDQVPVNFTVENRGGANPGNFQVQVLLADNNTFDSSSKVLTTLTRAELAAGSNGRDFSSPAGFSVTVPAGLASRRDYLGLRIPRGPCSARSWSIRQERRPSRHRLGMADGRDAGSGWDDRFVCSRCRLEYGNDEYIVCPEPGDHFLVYGQQRFRRWRVYG